MKSFTKVAALAAVLSTAVVPCVSAMEETEVDFNAWIVPAAIGTGALALIGGIWYFVGGNKATDNNVVGDASKVEAALVENKQQVEGFIARQKYTALKNKYGVTKADVQAYQNK